MPTPNPACQVNGSPTPRDVGASSTINGGLVDPTGADFWSVQAISTDELNSAAAINATLTIDQVHKTFSCTAPAGLGSKVRFKSIVGIRGLGLDINDVPQPEFTTTFAVNVKTAANLRVLAFDETLEQDAAFGHISEINKAIRAIAGGGAGAVVFTGEPTHTSIVSARALHQMPADAVSLGLTDLGSDTSGVMAPNSGNYATCSGGDQNEVSAQYATVCGGFANTASAFAACVCGGQGNVADGTAAHAEGSGCSADGSASHAEGSSTSAQGDQGSHSEGSSTTAFGVASHAEGSFTDAGPGTGAHSEGVSTQAVGAGSHAEGALTIANGAFSNAKGEGAFATFESQHVQGGGPATAPPTAAACIQTSILVLRGVTPGSVPGESVNLAFDGSLVPGSFLDLVTAKSYGVTVEAVVRTAAGGGSTEAWVIKAAVSVDAGVVTVRGTSLSEHFGDAFLAGSTLAMVAAAGRLNINYALAGGVTAAVKVAATVRWTETN